MEICRNRTQAPLVQPPQLQVFRAQVFWQYQLATSQYQMGSIDILKPLSTVSNNANNKSQQHQEKNSWNAENQTHGCWVRSKYAAFVQCSPPLSYLIRFHLWHEIKVVIAWEGGGAQYRGSIHDFSPSSPRFNSQRSQEFFSIFQQSWSETNVLSPSQAQ